MRDPQFRREQREQMYARRVAPINKFVDVLRGQSGLGWAPRVAPVHGGVDAQFLWILRDAGPAVVGPDQHESGFLCVENNDPTAERLCHLLDVGRIEVRQTMPWNAYPWYINKAPTAAQLRLGLDPLANILKLLEHLKVVALLGTHAQRSWQLLIRQRPDLENRFLVLRARHPGRQAFIGTIEQRAKWKHEQEDVFREAGRRLRAI